MKTSRLLINFIVANLVASFLGSTVLLAAQENPQPPPVRRAEQDLPRYRLEIENGYLLTGPLKDRIDIHAKFGNSIGGDPTGIEANLGNLVDVLRALHTNANIVLEPSLTKIKVADLKIRSIRDSDDSQLREELLALSVASGYKFRWEQPGGGSGIDPLTGQPLKNEASLYVLSPDLAAAAPAPRRTVEVFNVAGYLQQQAPKELHSKLETITTIIKSSVRQLKRGEFSAEDDVTFEFHPGANLLIVAGPQDSIEIARKVVNALPGQAMAESRTRNILVMGAVSKPGPVALPEEEHKLTIIDAIGLAGGTTKLANTRKIEFTRNGKTEAFSFDNLKKMTDQNRIYLEPGDIIKVPETFF